MKSDKEKVELAMNLLEKGTPKERRTGSEAAAHARALLIEALGSAEVLDSLIGGRPPINPDAKHGEHAQNVTVRVGDEALRKLDHIAELAHIKRSALIREAIDDIIIKKEKENHIAS